LIALSKEKHSVRQELHKKIKEIRKEKSLIKKQIQAQTESLSGSDAPALSQPTKYIRNSYQNCREGALSEPENQPKDEQTEPRIGKLQLGGKPSRNIYVSTAGSEEVKAKSSSQHPTPRTANAPFFEPPEAESFPKKEASERLLISQAFEQHESRMAILQKDKEIYEVQNKKMMQRVMTLQNKLEEAKLQANKCTTEIMIGYR